MSDRSTNNFTGKILSSVQFSCSVMSDSLQLHESQHARPPCPSPTPGVHSESRPSSQWCHPAISSPVIPFSSCPQSLPASESFPMSQLFTWSGQSTGVSALASFLPKKSQGWSPSEWTVGSPCSPRDSWVFSNTTVQNHQFFSAQLSSQSNSHIHTWPLENAYLEFANTADVNTHRVTLWADGYVKKKMMRNCSPETPADSWVVSCWDYN